MNEHTSPSRAERHKMEKYNKNLPVWFRLVGDSKRCAGFIGLGQRLRELHQDSGEVECIQVVRGDTIVVRTPYSGEIIKA